MTKAQKADSNDRDATGDRHEIDWSSARVPDGAVYLYYLYGGCGDKLCVSPRANSEVMPTLFCTCESNGPPYWKHAVEFNDGEIVRNEGYENEEVPFRD